MAKQLYNEFADIGALEAQKKSVLKIFDQIKSGVKDLSALGFKIDSAKSISELTKALGQLEKAKKQYTDLQKKYIALTEEQNKTTQRGTKLSLEEKLAQQELAKIQKERIRLRQSEEGSQEQLNLQYNKAIRILNSLSEAQRNSTRGQNLEKFAANLNEQLKGIEQRTGNFRRNVGNYANSLADGFEKVRREIDKLKTKQTELNDLRNQRPDEFNQRGGEDEIKRTSAALEQLNGVLKISYNSNQTYSKSVKQIETAYQNLAASGNVSNEFLNEFREFAAEARDSADDLRAEIKRLSSDTRLLDEGVETVSLLASGFEAYSGVLGLVGEDQENIEKTLARLTAIQSIANGVREIGKQITEKGTVANRAYNFVLAQTSILFGKGVTGAQRFNAALKLTAIGFLITGIITLINKLDIFSSAAEEAKKAQDKLTESFDNADTKTENYIQTLDELGKIQIQNLKKQQAENRKFYDDDIKMAEQSVQEKKELRDQELKTAQEQDATRLRQLGKSYDDYSKAKLKLDEYVETKGKGLNRFRKITVDGKTKAELTGELNAATEHYKKLEKEYQHHHANLVVLQRQGEAETAEEDADAREEAFKRALAANEREKKAALELLKFRQGLIIEEQNFRAGEDSIYGEKGRVEAAEKSAQAQRVIAKAQRDFDISQKELSASQRTLIEETYAESIRKINRKLSSDILTIRLQENLKLKQQADESVQFFQDAQDERFAQQTDMQQKQLEQGLAMQEKFYADDLKANAERYKKGEIDYKQYSKRKEEIELSYQKGTIDQQIIFYEQQIKLFQSFGLDVTAMVAALAKLKADLVLFDVDTAEKSKEEIKSINQQIKDNYFETFKEIASAANSILGGIAEARKQRLQEEIDDIDRLKAAEIDRVTKSTDNEERKAARIKIIEAQAQNRKEELERKQRQIDRQRAISERAFKAFQITTDTIQAVNKIRLLIAAAPDPLSKALYSSQLVLAIASGAASLASILATPLPKFWKGGIVEKDGPISVAEKGREFAVDGSGKLTLYENPSIIMAKKGTRILANNVTENMIAASEQERGNIIFTTNKSSVYQDERLYSQSLEANDYLKKLVKKPVATILINANVEATAYYKQQMKD